MNELQLTHGPYRTTAVGIEIVRQSTKGEWKVYGEALRRLDEAKQWAIGDWLVDGKSHYGDGLYAEAAKATGLEERTLEGLKQVADRFQITLRNVNLLWSHHKEVTSIKTLADKNGKLARTDEHDMEKAQELLAKAQKEGLSVRELRAAVAEHVHNQDAQIRLANEPEKYSVVYADPPWEYRNSGFEMSAAQHYPTMPTDAICGLRVPVAENAVCFMWTTNPLLEDGLRVLKAWGFEYKTNLVWVKDNHTAGFYVYGQHEILLLGVRGSGQLPSDEAKPKSVIHGANDEHSRKPDVAYEIIEAMYPTGKRIEMFARRKRDGWDSFGNEVASE